MPPVIYDVLMKLHFEGSKRRLVRKSVLADSEVLAANYAKDVAKDEDGAVESKVLAVQRLADMEGFNKIIGLEQLSADRLRSLNTFVCKLSEVEQAYVKSLLTLYMEDPADAA